MNQYEIERHEAIQAAAMNDIIKTLRDKNVHPLDAIPALGASLEHVLGSIAEVRGWDSATDLAEAFCQTLMTNIEKTKRNASNQIKPN